MECHKVLMFIIVYTSAAVLVVLCEVEGVLGRWGDKGERGAGAGEGVSDGVTDWGATLTLVFPGNKMCPIASLSLSLKSLLWLTIVLFGLTYEILFVEVWTLLIHPWSDNSSNDVTLITIYMKPVKIFKKHFLFINNCPYKYLYWN